MKRNQMIPLLACAVMCAGCTKVEELPIILSSSAAETGVTYAAETSADSANSFTAGNADSLAAGSADNGFDNSRYIYSLLDEKEKEYYGIIRDAAMNFSERAYFPEPVEPETLRKLFVAVYYQEEDIFWLSSIFYRPQGPSDSLRLTYWYDKERTEEMKPEIKAAADRIMSGFTAQTSDYEKLRTFHDYLVLNCTFSKDGEDVSSIYGALCGGYAQCEGYAFAFDYLCRQADIDCFTVWGTNSEGAMHAWNTVRLEDMWYNVDCTWDDPILDPVDREFIRYYYFLAADEGMYGATHFPDRSYFALPLCTSTNGYYKREGYFAQSGSEGVEKLSRAAADALANGRKDAGVKFSDKRAYDSAYSKLFDGKEIKQVFAYANRTAPRAVTSKKYVRYCSEDELIIHISMIYQ